MIHILVSVNEDGNKYFGCCVIFCLPEPMIFMKFSNFEGFWGQVDAEVLFGTADSGVLLLI